MMGIHNVQVDMYTERGGGDIIRGIQYMVKMYLQVEMYTIFDDFTRINESGIKKLHVSILFLYK